MSEQVREQPAPRTTIARLVGVITSPGETFQDISRHPGWLPPFIIYLVVFCIGFGVYSAKADWITIITDQIEKSPIMKIFSDTQRDQAVQQQTADLRKFSREQLAAVNVIQFGSGQLPSQHFMVIFISTLFVMVGALKDLKLGRAWVNFLLCFLIIVGYFIVFGIAKITFRDAPGSQLLLSGTASIVMVGAWAWLLNRQASRDVEFHRMLSVYMYSGVVLMISILALMTASLVHTGDIQVEVDKMVPSNLGAFIDTGNAVVQALFNSLDLFTIWFFVVLTIGFKTVTRQTTGMAASMTFLPWGLYVMVKIAWAAVFG
ncbi:MAG TPA: YIP1 family protein [Patescibacteria group bacterium]|nr:YIP1 family protein [Patescibacteria group bacterium]